MMACAKNEDHIAGQSSQPSPLQIVGSSTATPFITAAAEVFGATSDFATPIIETTGTGGGIDQFCSNAGEAPPSIVMASRKMSDAERALCFDNGVDQISELKFGFDGIVVINSVESEPVSFSKQDLYLALSKDIPSGNDLVKNPYRLWSELRTGLPETRIEVFGPPPTSGTRDAFEDLIFVEAAMSFEGMRLLADTNPEQFRFKTHEIRNDGVWTDSGENDTEIIRSVSRDPNAFGIVGFSYLHQSYNRVQASAIDGVSPSVESILDGSYRLSRPLYLYVNDKHRLKYADVGAFISEVYSDAAIGDGGYLLSKGLVPLSNDERQRVVDRFVRLASAYQIK